MCQSREFPLSYAVIPSFISCFTTSCCIDPYFIFKLTFLNTSLVSFFCCGTASYNVTCIISPLVLSTSVGTEKADTIICKHLACLLSEKWSSPYSVVMDRLCCSLGSSLLYSSIMCIRGLQSRSSC